MRRTTKSLRSFKNWSVSSKPPSRIGGIAELAPYELLVLCLTCFSNSPTYLSRSSTAVSLSSSSFSLISISVYLIRSFFSFFSTSSCFLFMCYKLRLSALSLSLMLTCGKFNRSSTFGRSVGSTLSIHLITRINSSLYRAGILLKCPSFIFNASES